VGSVLRGYYGVIVASLEDTPATKRDLADLEQRVDARISDVMLEIATASARTADAVVKTLRAEFGAEMKKVREGHRADMAALREEIGGDVERHVNAAFEAFATRFDVLEHKHADTPAKVDRLREEFDEHRCDVRLHNKP